MVIVLQSKRLRLLTAICPIGFPTRGVGDVGRRLEPSYPLPARYRTTCSRRGDIGGAYREAGRTGERDPRKLCQEALKGLGIHSDCE
jgi:hypothetical protein